MPISIYFQYTGLGMQCNSYLSTFSVSVFNLSFAFFSGYLIMTDEWFSEYVYEVVVDKRFLSPEVLEVMKQEPVMLPAWDPMGALA